MRSSQHKNITFFIFLCAVFAGNHSNLLADIIIQTEPTGLVHRVKKLFTKKPRVKTDNSPQLTLPGMIGSFPAKIHWIIAQLSEVDVTQDYGKKNPLPYANRFLFGGPPGLGKTTLVEVVAKQANCGLIVTNGSSIVGSYTGEGAERVRQKFNEAIALSIELQRPVIVFIDEIDVFAINYDSKLQVEHAAAIRETWLKLDEYKNNPRVFFIAATNDLHKLHPTFLARFNKNNIFEFQNPSTDLRKKILAHYLAHYKIILPPNTKMLSLLAEKTAGFSNRELEDCAFEISVIARINPNAPITDTMVFAIVDKMKKGQKVAEDTDTWVHRALQRLHLVMGIHAVANIVYNVSAKRSLFSPH